MKLQAIIQWTPSIIVMKGEEMTMGARIRPFYGRVLVSEDANLDNLDVSLENESRGLMMDLVREFKKQSPEITQAIKESLQAAVAEG